LLVEKLKSMGKSVEVLDFPDYESEPGKRIKKHLAGEEELSNEELGRLYAEDRKLHVPKIQKWLSGGKIVIADRYAYSNIAYQLANGTDYNYLISLDNDLIFPEIVFFVDVDIDEVIRRMDNSRKKDKYESSKEFLKNVSQNYGLICDGSLDVFGKAKWIRINGNKTIEEVHKEIMKYVEACLGG
jgi:dTMP kinase